MSDSGILFFKTARTLHSLALLIKEKEDLVSSFLSNANDEGQLLQKQAIDEMQITRNQLVYFALKLDYLCSPFCNSIQQKCFPNSD